MEYIEKADDTPGCIFCVKPAEQQDRDNGIVYRGKTAFVMMNAFPYNTGHLMVAPYKHTADLYELSDEEALEVSHLVRYSVRLLTAAVRPDGFNLGVNLGRPAGAGFADHVHWHVVPRWSGDTNFMPVVGNTKVLPESLEATYDKLMRKMEELGET
jgi:ATP adenylyltransferase